MAGRVAAEAEEKVEVHMNGMFTASHNRNKDIDHDDIGNSAMAMFTAAPLAVLEVMRPPIPTAWLNQ